MSVRASLGILVYILCDILCLVVGEYCKDYGQNCPMGLTCCGTTCCASENYHHGFRWSLWNMWYFWFIVIFILMSCFGGCGYWRRRQLMLHQQQTILQHQQAYNNYMHHQAAAATAYTMSPPHTSVQVPPYGAAGPPPPAPQPEGSFPAPPPYSEVTKPGGYYHSPNKDGLPPYTEAVFGTDYNIMQGATQAHGADEMNTVNTNGTVPGLPPYSADPEMTPAATIQPQVATITTTMDQCSLPPNSRQTTQSTAVSGETSHGPQDA